MNTHSLRPASFYLFSNYRFYRTAKSLGQTLNSTIGSLSYIFIAQFIVNFTPFKEHPEFDAKYQLRNVKDSHLFTDRFNLIVLSLTQIKRATKEDKALGLDKWARLFKSKTWEDIRMVASDNKYMTSAIETAYLSSEDRNIIKIAREREDYLRSEAYKNAQLKKQSAQIKKQKTQIVQLTESNASKDATIAEQDATIAELKARIKELESKNWIKHGQSNEHSFIKTGLILFILQLLIL